VRILHLIATGQRRGAEMFAADLVAALDTGDLRQQVAVLRGEPPWAVRFGVPVTALGAHPGPPGLPLRTGALRALSRLLRSWPPDLIQAHGGETLKYAVAATGPLSGGPRWGSAGSSRRPPIVYRRIGSVAGWLSSGPRRAVYRRLVGRATRVVAVAESIRRETIDAFRLPGDRVVTIPNGVDPRRLQPRLGRGPTRAALGVPGEATVVLSLGALSWEKDPLGHLAVTAPLLRERPGAVHLFAGEGPLRGELEAAARGEGLDGRVRVLGSRADVGELLAASDLMLFASRTEGMPASVIEAGVAGLPVVGVALDGVPEVVEHGVTGLLVAPGDQQGLRRAAASALDDAFLRASLGRAAQARCRQRYGIDTIAKSYRTLYEELHWVSSAAS
jgi:glycosyltransferase involved in cell wall biosynthesis